MAETQPRICDYGDSTYRQDFWEGKGRDYEDAVERRVLQQILPKQGKRLLEIGAGFGRLTNEYHAYEHVVLLDYSLEQLQYARQQLGDDRYTYVAANAYHMPFIEGAFDGATMIRVLHHMENVPAIFTQIQNTMIQNGTFILEYANKRNLKAMLRHLLGRNGWSPYTEDPVEFVELNFNFHPSYIDQELSQAGFQTQQQIPISFFRLGFLKRTVPTSVLVNLDRILQHTGAKITPSIFTKNIVQTSSDNNLDLTAPEQFLICPRSRTALTRDGDAMVSADGQSYDIKDGVYDFRI